MKSLSVLIKIRKFLHQTIRYSTTLVLLIKQDLNLIMKRKVFVNFFHRVYVERMKLIHKENNSKISSILYLIYQFLIYNMLLIMVG